MPRIRFTFGFFALWAAVLTANEYYNNHYPALPIFLLCLAHESGHLFAAKIAGLSPECITFCAAGIRLSVKNGTHSRGLFPELLLLSAGCAVNFALVPMLVAAKMRLWAMVSLSLGIFNLLPLSSLDGGRLIRALCEYISPAADISSAQRMCDIIIITAALAYFLFHGFPPPLLPLIIAGLSALEKL